MIDIKRTANANQNETHIHGNDLPCVVCGRTVKNPKHWVRLFYGYTAVTEAEAIELLKRNDGGDLLYYPIHIVCLRRRPELQPYVDDAKRANDEANAWLEARWGKKIAKLMTGQPERNEWGALHAYLCSFDPLDDEDEDDLRTILSLQDTLADDTRAFLNGNTEGWQEVDDDD